MFDPAIPHPEMYLKEVTKDVQRFSYEMSNYRQFVK